MKKFFIIALLFSNCASPQTGPRVNVTSIDVEDFGEQIIELEGLPFDVVVDEEWTLETVSFAHQLWKTDELQVSFEQKRGDLSLPKGAEVIPSIDNSDIQSFCLDTACLIQVQGQGLFEAKVYTDAGRAALERLR